MQTTKGEKEKLSETENKKEKKEPATESLEAKLQKCEGDIIPQINERNPNK